MPKSMQILAIVFLVIHSIKFWNQLQCIDSYKTNLVNSQTWN